MSYNYSDLKLYKYSIVPYGLVFYISEHINKDNKKSDITSGVFCCLVLDQIRWRIEVSKSPYKQNGYVQISQSKIAKDLKISTNSVCKYIKYLIDLGIIDKITTGHNITAFKVNKVVLQQILDEAAKRYFPEKPEDNIFQFEKEINQENEDNSQSDSATEISEDNVDIQFEEDEKEVVVEQPKRNYPIRQRKPTGYKLITPDELPFSPYLTDKDKGLIKSIKKYNDPIDIKRNGNNKIYKTQYDIEWNVKEDNLSYCSECGVWMPNNLNICPACGQQYEEIING